MSQVSRGSRIVLALTVIVATGCGDAPTIPSPTLADIVGSWDLVEARRTSLLASSEQYDVLASLDACPVPRSGGAFNCIYKPLVWTIDEDGAVAVMSTVTGTDSLVPVPWEQELLDLRGDSLTFERLRYGFTVSPDQLRLSRVDTVTAVGVASLGFSTSTTDGRIPLQSILVLRRVTIANAD